MEQEIRINTRPVLTVLAGVNGAGKSSILGRTYKDRTQNIDWFNPDDYAREIVSRGIMNQTKANIAAWEENLHRLNTAIENGTHYAMETTLGGQTIATRIAKAAQTHDVFVWYCGLATPDLHLERVNTRVAHGGHNISEAKIRERWERSPVNLIALMPYLARLDVFDNSAEADERGVIPDPAHLLAMRDGKVTFPVKNDLGALAQTPEWARPIVEAAFQTMRRPQD